MARSVDNPYLHLVDKAVNKTTQELEAQVKLTAPPQRQEAYQDLPDLDHMSNLRIEGLKGFKEIKE